MAGNCCPPYGTSLAEAWDPSRILPLKQKTGGVVPEVLNRPAMGCDPFGIRSGTDQRVPTPRKRHADFQDENCWRSCYLGLYKDNVGAGLQENYRLHLTLPRDLGEGAI